MSLKININPYKEKAPPNFIKISLRVSNTKFGSTFNNIDAVERYITKNIIGYKILKKPYLYRNRWTLEYLIPFDIKTLDNIISTLKTSRDLIELREITAEPTL